MDDSSPDRPDASEPSRLRKPSLPSLLADQRRRCEEGRTFRVEEYVAQHPTLRDDADGLLDLIYNEVVLRQGRGESATLEEYQHRFPTLAEPLSDLFEVHRAIEGDTETDDEPVVLSAAEDSRADGGHDISVVVQDTKLSDDTLIPSHAGWPALEEYEILEVVGSGGMGIVFRARDLRRGVTVAVKTMQRIDAVSIYRFKQEFRALLDVAHPNLIALHELISDGQAWFIVMEFVAGVDFLTFVRRGSDLRVRLRRVLRQLAEGLSALHRAGKLHRDVKPSNVLVTHEGRVVIMDFGLATEVERTDSMEGQLIGTAGYMAPEQAAGLPTSEASDWYAVGVMLYEALTGRLPFVGRTLDVLMDKQRFEPPPPRELVSDVPEDLDALCVELLRRDPRARPPGAEVLRRLGGTADDAAGAESVSGSHAGDAPFVGRKPEYEALNEALRAMTGGASVAVFVRGRSGVGKSALVQRFLNELAARDEAVVLAGRCYERESVPYKALDSLIDGLSRYLMRLPAADVNALLPRDVGALGRVFPVLKRVQAVANAPHRGADVPDPQQLRRRAYAALRDLLGRLGDRHPLVLAIDDLQWGDTDSLAVLSEILRPPDPPVLLLLACYRTDDEAPFLRALAAWSEEETFDRRVIDVEPLAFDEARALARRLLGGEGPLNERRAEAVARESGGNPFFVAELTRSLQLREGEAAAERPGGSVALDDVLWSRVVRLPEEARRLLEVVAVSGRPVAPAVAWQCVERSGDERATVALLRSGRLLRATGGSPDEERVETYHDRVREAVVAHLGTDLLREVHRRLAAALEATGRADPEVLGAHYQGAGNLSRAAEHFAEAAAQANEALAFDRAATLYRLALDLRPEGNTEEARRLRAALGDALTNAGRGAEAAQAYLAACGGATVAEQRELRRRAAMQFLISGHIDQGLATLHDVLGAVGMALPATPKRALASLLFQRARLRLRGLGFRRRDTSEIAAADLTRIDVCWSAAIGLSNVDWIRGADFQARGLLLALRAGEPFRVARALTVEAAQTATTGVSVHHRTARLLANARTLSAGFEQPYAQGMIALATGVSSYLEGRWRDALTACDRAEAVFRDRCTGVAWELDTSHAYALWSLSHLGEWAELGRRFPVLIAEARERGDLYAEMNLSTYILSIVRMAADEPDAAREETARLMGQWSREGYHVQHNDQVWASVQIELYVGDGAAAWDRITRHWPTLSRSLLLRVQFIRTAMLGLRARCALADAERDDQRLASAQRDAARLDREGTPWARAQASLIRAGLAARRGRDDEAVVRLRDAVRGFREADMALCVAVAERRLGERLGGEEGADLRARADAWMTAQSIRRPDRAAALFAPGFPPQGA